jgi:hypothetical protein
MDYHKQPVYLLDCQIPGVDICSSYYSPSHNAIYPTKANKKLCKGVIDQPS